MAGVNKVFLVGNVCAEPDIKMTQQNAPVANFTVATNESWKDRATGEWQEKTEFHRVVAWRHLAERAEKYVTKGAQVYIEGKNETRKWTGKDGNDRYTTEVIARDMFVTGRKGEHGKPAGVGDDGHFFKPPPVPNEDDEGDDLPF